MSAILPPDRYRAYTADQWVDMADWTTPVYERSAVNGAGRVIAFDEHGDRDIAFEIVDNWRAAHNFPLNTIQVLLRRWAKNVDRNSHISQRIKRLPSVIEKIKRETPRMKLTQIQDIGGCRAVLRDVASCYRLLRRYYTPEEGLPISMRVRDYVAEPPDDGYRSIHVIIKFQSDRRPEFNDLKIEIQIRSTLQHAWATAVETIGTFEKQPLKWGQGDPDYLRFFALMSAAIAARERTAPIPGTPPDQSQLAGLATRLHIVDRLRAYAHTLKTVRTMVKGAHWYLLELDVDARQMKIRGFKRREVNKAEEIYMQRGRDLLNEASKDVVLVSVNSLYSLERAYPNYHADSEAFVRLVQEETARVAA